MSDDRFERTKKIILHDIRTMIPIADHQTDKHCRFGLLAQADSLENLGARIEFQRLPDRFVCSIMDDTRQETLLLLTDLRASLTMEKQELAPQVNQPFQKTYEGVAPPQKLHKRNGSERTCELRFAQLVSDLQALETVSDSLKSCMEWQSD